MAQPQSLVAIGASFALLDLIDLVVAINAHSERFVITGALDDNAALHGTQVGGVRVLGGLAMARDLHADAFVFTISSYRLRLQRIDILQSLGVERDRFVNLVHPRADVSPGAVLGRGSLIFSNVFVANKACLGDFNVVYSSAFVSPYCVLGDFAMMAGLAFIGAGAKLGLGAFAAASSTVAPNVTIGCGGMVGLASAAFQDVPAGTIVLGNPAVAVKSIPVPPHLLAMPDQQSRPQPAV